MTMTITVQGWEIMMAAVLGGFGWTFGQMACRFLLEYFNLDRPKHRVQT